MKDPVETRKHGAITVVTLDRADVRNAVDADTALLLYDAFMSFDADPEARVAVFHGAHGHFCAGWDLQAGARMAQDLQQDVGPFAALNFSGDDYAPPSPGPAGPWGLRACCCPSR